MTVAPQLECFFLGTLLGVCTPWLSSSPVLIPLSSVLLLDSSASWSLDGEGALMDGRKRLSGMMWRFCSSTTCGNP